jgi:hypothetical protein
MPETPDSNFREHDAMKRRFRKFTAPSLNPPPTLDGKRPLMENLRRAITDRLAARATATTKRPESR